MRRLLLLVLFLTSPCFADSVAFPDAITIGTFTFVGISQSAYGIDNVLRVTFNTTGVTAQPLVLNLGFGNQWGGATFGPFTSVGTFTTTGGIIACAPGSECPFLSILVFWPNYPVSFLLANGKTFTPLEGTGSLILPLPGQQYVQPGQSVPILVRPVPEPTTMLLFGTGVLCHLARRLGRKISTPRTKQADGRLLAARNSVYGTGAM